MSTLTVDALGNAHYVASKGIANNVTLSERFVPLVPQSTNESTSILPFLIEDVITDTSEKINVTGTGASRWAGSGTNQVTTLFAIPSLVVDVQDGNDIVNVQAINYAATIEHNGVGSDTVNVGNTASGVQAITGPLKIIAGFNNVTNVNVNDAADTRSHPNVTLSNSAVLNLAPAAINYQQNAIGTLHVTVTGGSGTNSFTITDTPHNAQFALGSMTLNTGSGVNQVNVRGVSGQLAVAGHGGTDTVTVGSLAPGLGGTLANIHATVSVSNTTNSTRLLVDDSGDLAARQATITFDSVTFAGIGAAIDYFAGVKTVEVFGSKGGDIFQFLPQLSTTPIFIQGSPGVNTLVSATGVNNWTIVGKNAGTLDNLIFENVQNLHGGLSSSSDTFHFSNGASVTGNIVEQGFGSVATLDYSKYTTQVFVDLKTQTATGVGGGVFQVRNVIGGSGNNILVGDGFNNFLEGGSGRDILISGGGNSILRAGSGEAILLGAHYLFDTNATKLQALMTEWSSPLPYALRVHDLIATGAISKATVVAQPGSTTLISGADLDFLVVDPGDILANPPRPGEIVLNI